jgi:hypothetical protein
MDTAAISRVQSGGGVATNAKVKNELSYTVTPPVCLHGILWAEALTDMEGPL